ncbi:hypothetical protein EU95_0559 [Prochlorococcus marinus str. MIT 9201]|uniref:Uncharacterized protein n=1 Tax=Prochlorococcus marinus str. MIT 9201 TaxID=93057 RepID=A0A0A2A837_PROMR|nr:hypothetical protein EU95_0559 [Prochlorococcus marinus str. MIT 9201]
MEKIKFTNDKKKYISESLNQKLIKQALLISFQFWSEKLKNNLKFPKNLYPKYYKAYKSATECDIFQKGGIDIKDHINIFVLLSIIKPGLYCESGVFKGSSIHSALHALEPKIVYGIDPKPKLNKRIKSLLFNEVETKLDFNEFEFDTNTKKKVVFFDDHINSMQRIIDAKEKGFKYIIFDDSTGFEGIGQRRYPALPTVGMLKYNKLFNENDFFSWSLPINKMSWKSRAKSPKSLLKKYIKVTARIDKRCKDEMNQAEKYIKKIINFPDLSELLFASEPGMINNTQKYIILL